MLGKTDFFHFFLYLDFHQLAAHRPDLRDLCYVGTSLYMTRYIIISCMLSFMGVHIASVSAVIKAAQFSAFLQCTDCAVNQKFHCSARDVNDC